MGKTDPFEISTPPWETLDPSLNMYHFLSKTDNLFDRINFMQNVKE